MITFIDIENKNVYFKANCVFWNVSTGSAALIIQCCVKIAIICETAEQIKPDLHKLYCKLKCDDVLALNKHN